MKSRKIFENCGLDPKGMEEVSKLFKPVEYPMDAIVFHEGDKSDKFCFIKSGQALVTRKSPGGDEEPLAVLKEGQCFGEIGIVEDIERTATVKAIGPLELLEVGRENFLALLEGNPSFAALI
ncbi:MAG: cyclic nucleotide-binding domain-containing protein [bacterium]|nr:cyclic nucleotide-binding domain-containing protein [bacterium]